MEARCAVVCLPHGSCCLSQVHKVLATGGLAVVGVMMEAGGVLPNPTVQTAYVFAPPNPKEQVAVSINHALRDLFTVHSKNLKTTVGPPTQALQHRKVAGGHESD